MLQYDLSKCAICEICLYWQLHLHSNRYSTMNNQKGSSAQC
ncbi:10146_t:CDS:2 [Cetraspora pellucida]|uniref:10146_t:CDS:1 n=1 Tax=Cetraspora pellucida TaxID=1433469 RepID=A0A9N9ENA7_9GLOM|nr:10146_t:CDS:2 [Cetraspora pellucida]